MLIGKEPQLWAIPSDCYALPAPATSLKPPLPPKSATKGVCLQAWPGPSGPCCCNLAGHFPHFFLHTPYWLLNILNILPLEEYHERRIGEGLQTFGGPMTPRTLVSTCDDGGKNSPGLFSWWNMSHMFFAFLLVYCVHSKAHKSEVYSSLNFYVCAPMYPPPRSRYETSRDSQPAPSRLLSNNYPK